MAVLLLTLDTALQRGLLAGIVGQLVFVVVLESPVSLRILGGEAPRQAFEGHFTSGAAPFLWALGSGIGAGVACYYLL
jgi:hypothetical protein